jgi:hypothetical protein
MGIEIFLVAKKRGMSYFLESSQHPTPFCGQKNLVTIKKGD